MEHLTEEQQTTLKFIIERSTTELDLKWKLNKYIETGDLSFLGKSKSELDRRIKVSKRPKAKVGK